MKLDAINTFYNRPAAADTPSSFVCCCWAFFVNKVPTLFEVSAQIGRLKLKAFILKGNKMYKTVKYNKEHRHNLDIFENSEDAIESAKTLHNPDWPCWQGIMVLTCKNHPEYYESIFDTNQ